RIIGIDINAECKKFEEDQIEVFIGQQEDHQFLQGVLDKVGIPDIVLDDGSHKMSHITATFQFLYPRLLKNGVYMVEDLHTAYWTEYEGGLRNPTTFIELCKNLIDELNADHSRGALPPTEFTRTTTGIHFYDSMAVFERGAYTKRFAFETGGPIEKLNVRFGRKVGLDKSPSLLFCSRPEKLAAGCKFQRSYLWSEKLIIGNR